MAVSLITTEERYGVKMAVFSVSLTDKSRVFMCAQTTPYENDNRGVVIVDAGKFLALWRSEPASIHRELAQGTPETWPKDRNFTFATEVFSQGIANPVPLPWVAYSEQEHTSVSYKFLLFGRQEHTRNIRYVSFINGITRTILLLSHGCEAFPVECSMPAALKLHQTAALDGTRPFTLADMQQGTIPV